LAGLLSLFISFIPGRGTLDLHLHDTYFVLSGSILFMVLAGFLFLLWGIYKFAFTTNNSHKLTWIHIILTLSFSLTIIIIYIIAGRLPTRYEQFKNWSAMKTFEKTNDAILITIILLMLSQVFLFLNVMKGILTQKRQSC
jgi:hypothetical protein